MLLVDGSSSGISHAEAEKVVAGSSRAKAAAAADDPFGDDGGDGTLKKDEVTTIMGYPPDGFQCGCLEVIVHPELDLLAMAPTGSGKTAVALMAILQAFRRGKKAVYTSPIKALSNQKYAEFKAWFSKRGMASAGVALLTGDIKIRSPPGVKHELIICTSEILRNKLVKNPHEQPPQPPPAAAAAGGAEPAPPAKSTSERSTSEGTSMRDLDLDNLGPCLLGCSPPSTALLS